MKRLLALVMVIFASVAFAQNPHFIKSKIKTTLWVGGRLDANFKEAGLGDADTNYLLKALAHVECTCSPKSRRFV